MFKVLIVEDEMLVRLGLKNLVDWSRFDMQVISDVANGQAAWEVYENEHPDVIITDLKMPVMDGMELIARVREKDKATRIVILSCLKEFELAQQAVSLGVSDYLLKLSMTEEDIGRVLMKLQSELKEETTRDKEIGFQSAKQTGIMKDELLKDFLFYRNISTEQFTSQAKKLNMRLDPRNLLLCILEIDGYEGLKAKFQDTDGKQIRRTIVGGAEEIMANAGRGEPFFDSGGRFLFLMSFPDVAGEQQMMREALSILGGIKNFAIKYFDTSVTFGLSGIRSGYDSLEAQYREACKSLEKKYVKGACSLLYPDAEDLSATMHDKIGSLRDVQGLAGYLGEVRYAEYLAKLDVFQSKSPTNAGECKELLYKLVEWIFCFIWSEGMPSKSFIQPFLKSIQEGDTLDGDIAAFCLFTGELLKRSREKQPYSMEIAGALQYMRGNFARDLSLQEVSGHINLSPGYLSSLFKKELNVNFTEYLNELRIDKAKTLLAGTYLKSYEIAEKVGFADSAYFSRVFKKVTGSGPNEFRRRHLRNWTEEIENESSEKD